MRRAGPGVRVVGMLLSGAMLYFFANVQRVAIPGTVFDSLQAELNLSAPSVTGFGSAFMYLYALAQLPVGMLVDRFGGIRVIATGAACFCAGSLLFALARNPGALYLARMLTGLGAATFYLSLIRETILAFERDYGIAISVVIMIGYAGGIAAAAPFAAAVEAIGFRNVLLLTGVIPMVFACAFLGFSVPFPPLPERRGGVGGMLLRVLSVRHNRELFCFSGINFGLYYVLQTVIGRKFLQDFCNMDPTWSAWVFSITGVLSASANVLFAVVSRATGNRRRIFCRFAGVVGCVVFPTLTLLVGFDIRTAAVAVLFCLLALTASLSAILIPLLRETNPEEASGSAIALMNFSFYLAVAVFGNLVGWLMNLFPPAVCDGIRLYGRGSYLTVFGVLSVFAVVSAVLSWRLRETRGERRIIEPDGRCPGGSAGRE